MGIVLKTPEEIEAMRVAGQLAGEVLRMIREHVRVGITTGELDDICHHYITREQKAIPAPLNYKGFPKSICTSVNHVVCHGIPGDKKLKNGDIVNIDITVIKEIVDENGTFVRTATRRARDSLRQPTASPSPRRGARDPRMVHLPGSSDGASAAPSATSPAGLYRVLHRPVWIG